MKIESIKRNNKMYITGTTEEFVTIGTILTITFKEIPRYFKIIEVETSSSTTINFIAENCGYYSRLQKDNNIDIRDLINLNLEIVTDEKILQKLKKESTYL